jgi:hypothetical protein
MDVTLDFAEDQAGSRPTSQMTSMDVINNAAVVNGEQLGVACDIHGYGR